jgi:hypothetical protein
VEEGIAVQVFASDSNRGNLVARIKGNGKKKPIDGIPVKVLPLERVIASKRSTNRPKDLAALPALEAALRARDAGS